MAPDIHLFKEKSGQQPLQHITGHPRLLMTDQVTENIKFKIKSDSIFQSFHTRILKSADRYISDEPQQIEKTGKRLLNSASDFSKRIITIGYAFRMTLDKKYLIRAIEDMKQICSLESWNPEHFLDVAEITFGVSLGYDWLYHFLDEETRELCRHAILEKGLLASMQQENNRWLVKSNNWNQVCNAGMVAGALAVYENQKELASQMILRSLESNQKALEAYGGSGDWPEGYGYWSYGTHFQVILFSMLETAFVRPFSMEVPQGFMKTPDYLLNMIGPSGKVFNYSDAVEKPKVSPAMFWFASKKGDSKLLHIEKKIVKEGKNVTARDLVFLMIWAEPKYFHSKETPSGKYWYGNGNNPVAIMRTGWGESDLYTGIKGGSPSVSHGHMDVGSFVLDVLGERWVMDLGTEDYNKLESAGLNIWSYKKESDRWKITRYKNQAHSTITINGLNQNVSGYVTIENMTSKNDNPAFLTDLSSMYEPQVIRLTRLFILSEQGLNIKDEMKTGSISADVQWTIITDAEILKDEMSWITLRKNGKSINLKIESNQKFKIRIRNLKPDYDFENTNQGIQALDVLLSLPPQTEAFVNTYFSHLPNTKAQIQSNSFSKNDLKWGNQ